MKIEKKKIADLIPAEYNPRKDLKPGDPEFEKLKRSIEEFGLVEPVIFNKRTGRIVGGHQRVKVLQEMGKTETDVVTVDLPEDREKALNVALNKVTGEWDQDKLKDLIFDLSKDPEFDVTLTGFDEKEIDEIIDLRKVELGEADEDEYQEPEKLPARTKPGDVWILGENKLICGDCTDPEVVKKLMGGRKADLLLTDPPYNVQYIGKTKDELIIKNDRMPGDTFEAFLFEAFSIAREVMRPGAAFYVWHAPGPDAVKTYHALPAAGLQIRECLIWAKNTFVLGHSDYHYRHEPCMYGWNDGAGHYFVPDRSLSTVIQDEKPDFSKMKKAEMQRILEFIFAEDFSASVFNEDKPAASRDHPTMKPVKLMARQIANSTRPGETVLDIFAGSGSTLIAAEQLKRKCFLVEIDPHYCDVIVDRWEKLTGKKGVKDARH